jgi:hypothetical protein
MADTLVERVTGQASADQVPVEVNLVIDTDTLLGNGSEPALLNGEPLPARTRRAGCAASTPTPAAVTSSPWTPNAASSPEVSGGSSRYATRCVEHRGAKHPSGTPITCTPPRKAGRPASTTATEPASAATSPKKNPAGKPAPDREQR